MLVHLQWSKNPKLVRETRIGITACGIKAPHEELMAFVAKCHLPGLSCAHGFRAVGCSAKPRASPQDHHHRRCQAPAGGVEGHPAMQALS